MSNRVTQTDGMRDDLTVGEHSRPADEIIDINELQLEEVPSEKSEVRQLDTQSGKIGWAILWLLGVPLPLLLIAYLIWGR